MYFQIAWLYYNNFGRFFLPDAAFAYLDDQICLHKEKGIGGYPQSTMQLYIWHLIRLLFDLPLTQTGSFKSQFCFLLSEYCHDAAPGSGHRGGESDQANASAAAMMPQRMIPKTCSVEKMVNLDHPTVIIYHKHFRKLI